MKPNDSDHEITGAFRDFVETSIAPHLDDWNDAGRMPRSAFTAIAGAGITRTMLPADLGGDGGLRRSRLFVEEMMRYPCAGVLTSVLTQSHTVIPLLATLGTPAQRAGRLSGAVDGTLISGIAITDPAGGSDLVRSIGLRATKIRDGWRLDGEKMFITNGPIADFLVVLARTDPDRGALGMTLFIVDTRTTGFTVTETLDKLGLRASVTGRLRFDNCVVPDDALLGESGQGFRCAMEMLSNERLLVSIAAVAMSRQCLRLVSDGSDTPATEFAAEAVELDVLSAALDELVEARDRGLRRDHEIAAVKFMTADLAQRVTQRCLRAAAHRALPPVAREHLAASHRDARVLGVFAGSSETMRDVFAARLTIGRGLATTH